MALAALVVSAVILDGVASDDVSIPGAQMAKAPSRIIVPLDGGQLAERAIPVAISLAARAPLPISLVTVLSEHDLDDNATVYLESRKAELPGLRVDLVLLRGMPVAETLVQYLHREPQAVVCCSTHARLETTVRRLGSVAEELVRRSPVPVVLVGPRVDLPQPGVPYEEVVVCIEDESAGRVVPCIRNLAAALALSPSLMQVVEPAYGAATPEHDARRSALVESLGKDLAPDTDEVSWELVEDRTVTQAIAAFARHRRTPLLAFASRQRSPEERYGASSVTVAVAGIASCPLLVIGPSVSVGQIGDDRPRSASVEEPPPSRA